jgi:hypothetical protein
VDGRTRRLITVIGLALMVAVVIVGSLLTR